MISFSFSSFPLRSRFGLTNCSSLLLCFLCIFIPKKKPRHTLTRSTNTERPTKPQERCFFSCLLSKNLLTHSFLTTAAQTEGCLFLLHWWPSAAAALVLIPHGENYIIALWLLRFLRVDCFWLFLLSSFINSRKLLIPASYAVAEAVLMLLLLLLLNLLKQIERERVFIINFLQFSLTWFASSIPFLIHCSRLRGIWALIHSIS